MISAPLKPALPMGRQQADLYRAAGVLRPSRDQGARPSTGRWFSRWLAWVKKATYALIHSKFQQQARMGCGHDLVKLLTLNGQVRRNVEHSYPRSEEP
ncbi:MAG: hypothetical protein NTY53_26455 [Kiritimatiellaeota bacterium]|nr:hypothetical protein [Kiritimatiellota bacterium]